MFGPDQCGFEQTRFFHGFIENPRRHRGIFITGKFHYRVVLHQVFCDQVRNVLRVDTVRRKDLVCKTFRYTRKPQKQVLGSDRTGAKFFCGFLCQVQCFFCSFRKAVYH